MVRVPRSSLAALSRPSSASDTLHSRLRGQDKNFLSNQVQLSSTSTTPPDGHTFLAIGYPELIKRCKEISEERGAKVRDVSALAAGDHRALTSSLHRIGYHIRTDIFDDACQELNYHFRGNKLVQGDQTSDADADNRDFSRTFERFGADLAQMGLAKPSARQELATKVKSVIRELFPFMPDENVDSIFDTSWQEGANTVGNNNDLPLSRKVQLATVAHVRHVYTDYDRLLGTSDWHDSRRAVEKRCLDMILQWSGKDPADNAQVEAIMTDLILPTDDENEHQSDREAKKNAAMAKLHDMLHPGHRTSQLDLGIATNHIDAPVDGFGRGPTAFVKDGFEFTRIPAAPQTAPLTPYNQFPPPLSGLGTNPVMGQQPMMQSQPQYMALIQHPPAVAAPVSHMTHAPAHQSLVEISGQLYQLVPATQPQPSARRFFDASGREVTVDPLYHTLTPTTTDQLLGHQQSVPDSLSHPMLMPPPVQPLHQPLSLTAFSGSMAPPPIMAPNVAARAQSRGYAETVVSEGDDDDYDPGATVPYKDSAAQRAYSSSPSSVTEDVNTQVETMYDDSSDYSPDPAVVPRKTPTSGSWQSQAQRRRQPQQGRRQRRI